MTCVVCDGKIGCEFCPGGWVPPEEPQEPEVVTLARRLVRLGASYPLVVVVGEAFGHTPGPLLDEMRRLGSS